jgi:hypothetical protein
MAGRGGEQLPLRSAVAFESADEPADERRKPVDVPFATECMADEP